MKYFCRADAYRHAMARRQAPALHEPLLRPQRLILLPPAVRSGRVRLMFKPWDVYLFDKQAIRRPTKKHLQFTAWRVCPYSVMVADGTKRVFHMWKYFSGDCQIYRKSITGGEVLRLIFFRSDFFIHRDNRFLISEPFCTVSETCGGCYPTSSGFLPNRDLTKSIREEEELRPSPSLFQK